VTGIDTVDRSLPAFFRKKPMMLGGDCFGEFTVVLRFTAA
jgi:hypothetical protein